MGTLGVMDSWSLRRGVAVADVVAGGDHRESFVFFLAGKPFLALLCGELKFPFDLRAVGLGSGAALACACAHQPAVRRPPSERNPAFFSTRRPLR
jgi:hypothetical protein